MIAVLPVCGLGLRARRSRRRRAGTLLEQCHPLLEDANLLRLDVLIHALPLETAGARALARPATLGRRLAHGPDDEVVQLREDRGGECIDLEFDLLRALNTT